MWVNKHKPKKLEEIVGNKKVIEGLRRYNWEKPLLLHGPTGVGKTTLVEALANELNFDLVEINDSNIENSRGIVQSHSLFGNRKLVFIDNVDRIHDIRTVTKILKESRNPLILITSDFKSKRLATVKKLCQKVQMKRPTSASIIKLLRDICEKEGIEVRGKILKWIAENASGDVRAAINDLETVAKGKNSIGEEDMGLIEERDRISDIYKALSTILIKKDIQEAIKSTYDLDEQPQDILLWIDENLPNVVRGKNELNQAYKYLSRADIFLGRITDRQYWGFLRYANSLMTAGVNVSKGDKVNFAMYRFPFYIIRMSQTKKERNLKKNIGSKLSGEFHCSSKTIANEYIPLLRTLIKKGKMDAREFGERFRLDEDEVGYLMRS
ncbi:MAG: replication factor C large subunit [Candidatus Altiarchaeales archaeon]|nr:MAG: replication factor C large subunit [Candidatus Altiarchaeales archaeon]